MNKYPVTQAQYQAVMETNPSLLQTAVNPEYNTVNRPVENVSSWDAIVFCNKLSMAEGLSPAYLYTNGTITISTDPADWGTVPTALAAATQWLSRISVVEGSTGYRLPTEAQWEYACRAGTETVYNTGDTISYSTGWYASNSGNRTREVGAKPPNAWGLYDMHGNVSEWCWDRYSANYYTDDPAEDPTGATSGANRVTRGGSWQTTNGGELRSAFRASTNSFARNNTTGFRPVRPAAAE
jgi:formylglycine-generating enzyme required for sulfatase activity